MINKKTVFIVISRDIIRRNIFDTNFLANFIKTNKTNRIIFIVEAGKKDFYLKNYKNFGNDLIFEEIKKEKFSFWHRIVLFLISTGLYSHGVTLYRKRSYSLEESTFWITLVKTIISNGPARFNWYKKLIRSLYSELKFAWVEDLFEKYRPDLVFTPSLIDINVDAHIAISAKKRGIRVVGMVRSWDNLVIHGLLPVIPDLFILQNKWLKESAEDFQGINMSQVDHEIIGLPHYDRYKDVSSELKGRSEFFRELGLDPSKRLIFLGGFDFYYSEDVLPKILDDAILQGKIANDVQVLFTQHPKSIFKEEDYGIKKLKNVKYLNLFGGKEMGFLDTESTFINIVYYADVVINVASTLSIDAAVFDKPIICVSFDDPLKKIPRWQSVRRLHDSFDHYERLLSTGGVKLAQSKEELVTYINQYLDDPTIDKNGRKSIIDLFVAPFDGSASKRLADILAKEVSVL